MATNTGTLSHWFVRSQLADNKPTDFLIAARRKLARAGMPPAAIDRLLNGEMDDFNDWKFHADVSVNERQNLLLNFFQAARLSFSDAQSVEIDGNEIEEANIAREKICLEELTKKYSKIVDRWEQRLPFDDPQLEEASRTFLYGFLRASIVLCASAVETQLRRLVPSTRDEATAAELIQSAQAAKLLHPDLASHARDALFWNRNRVVHDNYNPSHDRAREVLGVARMLVRELRAI